MANVKLSVSVDQGFVPFIERYQQDHTIRTKSEVVERALDLLRKAELEQAYKEAAQEWLENSDAALWENTVADGLEPEQW
jgi:Arc/MetJ-type ribon-helix-helix transcriptional regulator